MMLFKRNNKKKTLITLVVVSFVLTLVFMLRDSKLSHRKTSIKVFRPCRTNDRSDSARCWSTEDPDVSLGIMMNKTLMTKLALNFSSDSKAAQETKRSLQISSQKLLDGFMKNNGKCLSGLFKDVLLVVVYHFPFYDSFPLVRDFYSVAFNEIIICGPQSSNVFPTIKIDLQNGFYAFECLAQAMRFLPEFNGYLYVNDDMIVNWWNFRRLDMGKAWTGARIQTGAEIGKPAPKGWMWWIDRLPGLEACENSITELQALVRVMPWLNSSLDTYIENNFGKKLCRKGWSDFFYIPKRLAGKFQIFSNIFFKNKVFLEIAVPTILTLLDSKKDIVHKHGLFLPDKYGFLDFSDGKVFWKEYNYALNFIHPFKLHNNKTKSSLDVFKTLVVGYSKTFGQC